MCAGNSSVAGTPDSKGGRRGRFSKLDASRQEALTRALRGLSASARLPLAGIAGLRAAVRARASLARMRQAGGAGAGVGMGAV